MLSATGFLLASCALAQEAPTYRARLLEAPLGSLSVAARALNDDGTSVGSFFDASTGYFNGVVWDAAGAATVLSSAYGFVEADAIGILGDGTVLGSGSMSALEVSHAMVIAPGGAVTTLPSLAGDAGVTSAAFDADDAGTVVGRSALFPTPLWLSTYNDAVIWEGGVPASIGTLGGYFGEAQRINAQKRVIGRSNTATSDFARGFVWDPGLGMREITPAEPGGLGHVRDLDAQGRICGGATLGPSLRACLWADPDLPPVLLPALPGDAASYANAIDGKGTMAGVATNAVGTSRARLWWGGTVQDLNDLLVEALPFALSTALDLNEKGEILAAGDYVPGLGIPHVVLTPLPALSGAPAAISVGAGGTQALDLVGGPALGGALYLVAGSLSGTSPGIALAGTIVPLNPDPYLLFTISQPGVAPLAGSFGVLDGAGAAVAAFSLPSSSPMGLVGLKVHHAFVAVDPATGAIAGASNAAPLALLP